MTTTSAAVPRVDATEHVRCPLPECGGGYLVIRGDAFGYCDMCKGTGRVPVRSRRNWWRVLWSVMQAAPWVVVALIGWRWGGMTARDPLLADMLAFVGKGTAVLAALFLAITRGPDAIAYVRRRAEEE